MFSHSAHFFSSSTQSSLFNKWVVVPLSSPSPIPFGFAPLYYQLFVQSLSRDAMVFFPYRRCLMLHFHQVEVRLPTRHLVHSVAFCSLDPLNGGLKAGELEGSVQSSDRELSVIHGSSLASVHSVRRPPSPSLAHTHGMIFPSTIVLVPFTFLHGAGVLCGVLLS